MPTNDYQKFCETDTGTNLLEQAAYVSDPQRTIGNQPGIARQQLVNKVLRQSSFVTKVFADYLVQQTGDSVLDDSNDASLLAIITATFATGLPVASIIDMVVPAVPTGFLKTNGANVSRTTYAALFNQLVTVPGFTSQTFTVSIASPAVITKSAHGFVNGERLRLSTTGFLPTGLDTTTDYFVSVIDANTFNLQTMTNILAGTFVNTSGVQGGTHSYQRSYWGLGDGSTTFTIPDFRGAFGRAWDDSRGLDPSRVIASLQLDGFKSHTHIQNTHMHDVWVASATPNGGGGGPLVDQISAMPTAIRPGGPSIQNTTATNQNTGISETRPINYAIMKVIKY